MVLDKATQRKATGTWDPGAEFQLSQAQDQDQPVMNLGTRDTSIKHQDTGIDTVCL